MAGGARVDPFAAGHGRGRNIFIDYNLEAPEANRIDRLMIYFTSDTHFGDPRVLRIDRRPFSNMEEHDEALIANWNARVGPGDEVWHLGDFGFPRRDRTGEILARLNGIKHLIIGNNDAESTWNASGWTSVQHYRELIVDEQLLVLCHYPFRTWNKMGRKSLNLHGHSHGRLKPVPRQCDVGVDAQSLRPVTLAELLAPIRRRVAATMLREQPPRP
jgi:calcineurin-like phosphoesterase family protein